MVYIHLINHLLLYIELLLIPNDKVLVKNILIFEAIYGFIYKLLTFWYYKEYGKPIYPFETDIALSIDIYVGTAIIAVIY